MQLCRYQSAGGPQWGQVVEGHVYVLDGDPFSRTALDPITRAPAIQRGPFVGDLDEVEILAPVTPGKIVAVGRNYAAHAAELGNDVPEEPLLFFKPPSSVIGPGEAIVLLPETGRVDMEAELAVVIGRAGRFIAAEDAMAHVFGYTCANDISDRDFQQKDRQWARAKGFDTFCPLGPWIETELDLPATWIRGRINGELRQEGHPGQMVFDIPGLISYISRIMTLQPGDVLLTGTPAGVTAIQPGDVLEVEVEGIGTLHNPVTALDR